MQTLNLLIPPANVAVSNNITFISPCGDTTISCSVVANPYYHAVTFDDTALPSVCTQIVYSGLSYNIQHLPEEGSISEPIPFNPHLIEPTW